MRTLIVFLLLSFTVSASEIHDAAASADLKRIEALVQQDKSLLQARDKAGDQALHHAVRSTQLDAVELLIKQREANRKGVKYPGSDRAVISWVAKRVSVDQRRRSGVHVDPSLRRYTPESVGRGASNLLLLPISIVRSVMTQGVRSGVALADEYSRNREWSLRELERERSRRNLERSRRNLERERSRE